MKDYQKMLDLINVAMDNLKELQSELQTLVDDQLKEMDSMVEQYKEIERLNDRLGEMLGGNAQ